MRFWASRCTWLACLLAAVAACRQEVDYRPVEISIGGYSVASRQETLILASRNIRELRGIEHMTHLKSLNMTGNPIEDISPLRQMRSLEKLNLEGTAVANLGPLSDILNLRWLDIGRTPVSDLVPLRNLGELRYISAIGTRVTRIDGLAGLNKLEELWLYDTPLESLEGVPPNLKEIGLPRGMPEGLIEDFKRRHPSTKVYVAKFGQ